MISTTTHRLRQQSQALEGFLEAHGGAVSAGLGEGAVPELLEALRLDRRRLRAVDRRVALRLHEAEVARRRRLTVLAAVRAQMVRLRGLVTAGCGAFGPRHLMSLRSAISRHAPTLDGQARRAVYALRLRAAAGVRLRLAGWEASPAGLADTLEPLQLALAAAVAEGFGTSERLFAAQVERGICQKEAFERLRNVRDAVWRACHRAAQPRLAAQVRRLLARRLWRSARRPVPEVRVLDAGVREPRTRDKRSLQVHRPSVPGVSADFALHRSLFPGWQGPSSAVRRFGTGRRGDFPRKLASVPAAKGRRQHFGGLAPGVRACGDFFEERYPGRCYRSGAGGLRGWGRGPPGGGPLVR